MNSALLLLLLSHLVPAAGPEIVLFEADRSVRTAQLIAKNARPTGRAAGNLRTASPGPGVDWTHADTLVVCAPALRDALQPWLAFRSKQGHRLAICSRYRSAADIRSIVRRVAQHKRLKTVVLVGDAVDPLVGDMSMSVPTYMAAAKINIAWGSEAEIASDNWFADLDDDSIPELAIGRFPAGSPAELTAMIAKTLEYETNAQPGVWQRRVNLVAGVGGFGLLADAVIETAARSFVRKGIPAGYRTHITYASWRSPYCPDPRLFREEVIEGINEGCLCWVYIGHGFREGLDWIRVPIGAAPILTKDDVPRLQSQHGRPIAVFLSCYGAAFDGPQDSLAERMLIQSGGPVAIIGGTRVTMPYGMTFLSQALMAQMFDAQPETLGEVVLRAKQSVLGPDADQKHPLLDTMARAISPNADDLVGERREHVIMFHLLGDPLLRLPTALDIDVTVPRSIEAGEDLKIVCRSPLAGKCTVELTSPRGQLTFQPQPRVKFDGTHKGMQTLSDVHRKANEDRYVSQQLDVASDTFETSLKVPAMVAGPCSVRVFIQGGTRFALGAASLYVGE